MNDDRDFHIATTASAPALESAHTSRAVPGAAARRLARWLGAVAVAVGAAALIQWTALLGQMDSGLMALSFDNARITLMDRTMTALLAALLAAALMRRRSGAWVGAMLYFLLSYLLPFIAEAQRPLQAGVGIHAQLIPDALRLISFQLACIGGALAALGSVVGGALSDMLLAPLVSIARWLGERRAQRLGGALISPLALLATGLALVAMLAVTVQHSGDILTYGPTSTLYRFTSIAAPAQRTANHTGSGAILLVRYPSAHLNGMTRTAYIYLPPTYAINSAQRYPTLYLLHGSPGGPHDWFGAAHAAAISDALIAAKKMRETILILPDGNGPTIRYSEWANSFDGRQSIEDAIVQDLVVYVDSHFRTLASPAYRAIGGLSEGGFGAANIALHHPEVFGVDISLSGYYLAQGLVFGGSGASALSYRRYNSPLLYIATPAGQQALRTITFIIGDGLSDGFYLQQSRLFAAALQRQHARVSLITEPGAHSWALWTSLYTTVAPLVEPG